MCNATIELEILYRLPLPWSTRQTPNDPLAAQLPPHHPVRLSALSPELSSRAGALLQSHYCQDCLPMDNTAQL